MADVALTDVRDIFRFGTRLMISDLQVIYTGVAVIGRLLRNNMYAHMHSEVES